MISTSDAYRAWPDLRKVDVKWEYILQPLFDILLESEVLHTEPNGGSWCRVEDVMLDDMNKSDKSRKIVIDLLTKTGKNVVTAPAHIKQALVQYCKFDLQYVTPKLLRKSLKAHPSCYSHLNHKDKILLLKFVLSDSDFTELQGLELLPLSDKTFTAFGRRMDKPIYIDSADHPKSLLPGLQKMFLDTEVDDAVREQLNKAVKKGHTQLRYFNAKAVKRHLKETLPADWLNSADHVTWYPGRFNQPTIEWLKSLWEYFGKHFAYTATDLLDAVVGLPLLPVSPLKKQTKVQLARIQQSSSLVLASFNGERIDESVCQVLKDLGLTILVDLPEYIQHYPELVPSFVNPASPKGVLNAIGVVFGSPQKKKNISGQMKRIAAKNIRSFRKFLSRTTSPLEQGEFNLLQTFPLFETFPGSGGKESHFVSVKEVNIGAPIDGLPPVSVHTELLDLKDHSSSVLADLLNIKTMSHNDLLKIMLDDALRNEYSHKELDKLVKYTLDRFGIFHGKDFKSIKEKLQNLSFVLSCGNSRKKPSELFDPEIGLLKQAFYGEDVFPQEKSYFSQPEVLLHLRKLGLKETESVSAKDILRSVRQLQVKTRVTVGKAKVKFIAVLKLLEQNPLLLEERVERRTTLKNILYSIPWIPVLEEKPPTYPAHLPFKQIGNGCFACPKDVTSHKFINLVGSVKLLVDTRHVPKVSESFQWVKEPPLEDVIDHLNNVIETFKKSSDLDERKTREVFERIYDYFQNALKDTQDEVKELLASKHFILVGKQLFPARKLSFSSNISYPPYLSQLPDSYKHDFGELFKTVGVRPSFEIVDYIETLQTVKNKYGECPVTEEFAQVRNVLSSLANVMSKKGVSAKETISTYGSIFIPDTNGILKPSEDVCVKDCFWMPSEPDIRYVNEGLLPKMCITLGAKTTREKSFGKHVIPFRIPFGQHEKLTNRLKRILTGYPCDESILKELLQNADDAKATQVCFIKDLRQHPDTKVFEECWKPLQGPALCVYNNAPFTKSDIEGIQNLGEGSKGDDPNKTGQYGVGFNAVYHLTDAPTFISQGKEIGEVMCVFDPNLTFVPDADASNPGMMCTDLPALRKKFPDVFSCYDQDQYFPITNATMFRLPLRNKEMASKSKISNTAMTTRKLEKLIDDFKNELLQVLLFVNNVNEVSICEIDEETEELSKSFRVQSSLSPEDEKKRTYFSTYVKTVGESLRRGEISVTDIPLEKVSYVLELKDSRGLEEKWFVVQQIGFENEEEIPGNIEEAFERGDLGLLPRGGVASLIRSSDHHHQQMSGKAFCFLPLPFKTGLPVHINGHFALNHEDRRSLWRDDKGDYRSNWNDTLLRQVVAPCYVTLLDEVRQHISLPRDDDGKTYIDADKDKGESILSHFVDLFPSVGLTFQELYWKTLCKEVYHYMNAKGRRLLPVLRQENTGKKSKRCVVTVEWLPPTGEGRTQAFFDNLEDVFKQDKYYLKLDEKRNAAKEKEELLKNTLLAVGFNLLCIPMSVYKCFKYSSVDVSLVSPTDVISFFQTYNTLNPLCNVGSLPAKIRDTQFKSTSNLLSVLKYCKQDKTFTQRLEGLPFLLTEDETLRVFSQSHKVFLSKYYKLLPNCQSLFVHHELYYDLESTCVKPPVFETFNIAAFARFLPIEMDQEQYETADICIHWLPGEKNDEIPSKQWVQQVWKFFSSHIAKVLESFNEKQSSQRRNFSNMPYFERKQKEEEEERQDKEAEKSIIQEVLDPVKNWCLLPAFQAYPNPPSFVTSVEHVLVPIAISDTVIFLESPKAFSLFNETLKKMVLPQLNCRLIDPGASKTARQLVATLEDPQSILTLLIRRLDLTSFEVLQEKDCSIVLEYFNHHLTQLEPSSSKELKRLPLYSTIHDAIISISKKQAFVLSPRIPKDDMDIWEETAGIVFLKRSLNLERLYKFLGCHYEDEVDVYCDVIFEKIEEMSEEARLKHMTFVRELFKEFENESYHLSDKTIQENKRKLSRLADALFELKFITAKNGTLKRASSFYDPSNEVFKTMFENNQDMFPPEQFCDWKWLLFLRRIGLVHQVSEKQFLQFAKEVETEAKTSLDEGTRAKSEVLVTYLFEYENIATSKLLDDVKEICFIFPHVVGSSLQAIHEQYGSGKTGSPCICFQGSLASNNHYITWTTANFLPDYANPLYCTHLKSQEEKGMMAQRLGVLQNPSVDMVVAHCKNICNVQSQMNNTEIALQTEIERLLQRVVGIMTSIYKYLERNYLGNEEAIHELKNVRCIVVDDGKRFVFPHQISVDITSDQEISPYLYKIPLQLASHAELFTHLGTTNTVTAAQYSMVLRNIHGESGSKELHPNETTKVFKATKGFFETFGNNVQDTEITPLYFPGIRRNPADPTSNMVILKTCTKILYNDAPHLKERLKQFDKLILVKLLECGLKVSNEGLLVKKLPESIRPGMLTSVVHETLMEGDQHVSCSSTAQGLRQVLKSSEFCHGLIRLIKHADYESDAETSLDIPAFVQERLRCIRVYSVPNLRTMLVYNSTAIPKSETDVSCFEEETEEEHQKVWKIYIEKEVELSEYVSEVAVIIDRITGHLLKTMIVYLPILLSSKSYDIKGILDRQKIREDNSELEIQATCLPTPGNFIHITYHHLLVDDFTVFSPDEYVGYELDDPSLRGEDGTPTYIYAIVIEEVLEDGETSNTEPSLRKYRIEVGKGQGPIVVDAADLYKFYRPSQSNSECLDIEPFTGAPDEKPTNLDEVRKEVRRILQEAWKLSEKKRKKIIKRLFLKWHPDKNPGNESFCMEIFRFILAEIERLKKEDNTTDFDSACFGFWRNRAQCHRSQRSSFNRGGGFSRGSHGSNPQPGEARRWYKQAEADLEAASNDVRYERASYEWACFKCHQSAEKALKAAQYSIDADKTNVHNLTMIALDLNNDTLSRLASKLESIVGDSTRMRYPDRLRYPDIPHSVYTSSMASESIDLASAILREVETKFIN